MFPKCSRGHSYATLKGWHLPVHSLCELYKIDKINGYFNLLEYYLENLDLIMDMGGVFCGFSISYDHAYLRVFDDKRKTSFILKVTDITDDFFSKYDEHYYAMINQEHQEDIKNF